LCESSQRQSGENLDVGIAQQHFHHSLGRYSQGRAYLLLCIQVKLLAGMKRNAVSLEMREVVVPARLNNFPSGIYQRRPRLPERDGPHGCVPFFVPGLCARISSCVIVWRCFTLSRPFSWRSYSTQRSAPPLYVIHGDDARSQFPDAVLSDA
jgi:hypothetical protein